MKSADDDSLALLRPRWVLFLFALPLGFVALSPHAAAQQTFEVFAEEVPFEVVGPAQTHPIRFRVQCNANMATGSWTITAFARAQSVSATLEWTEYPLSPDPACTTTNGIMVLGNELTLRANGSRAGDRDMVEIVGALMSSGAVPPMSAEHQVELDVVVGHWASLPPSSNMTRSFVVADYQQPAQLDPPLSVYLATNGLTRLDVTVLNPTPGILVALPADPIVTAATGETGLPLLVTSHGLCSDREGFDFRVEAHAAERPDAWPAEHVGHVVLLCSTIPPPEPLSSFVGVARTPPEAFVFSIGVAALALVAMLGLWRRGSG